MGRRGVRHTNGLDAKMPGTGSPVPGTKRAYYRAYYRLYYARPAVFWVRRETESITTAASRTAPVIMY